MRSGMSSEALTFQMCIRDSDGGSHECLGHTAGVQPFADARHEDEREHEAEARRHRVEQRGGQVVLLALHEDGHALSLIHI